MEHELDTSRLLCPMPVIRTQDRIKTLQPGDVLTVTATDPGALSDIPTWCRINGHSVTESWQDGGEVFIRIVVGDA